MSRLLPAINGASFTLAALETLRERAKPRLDRVNFRGRTVSLTGGVAAATGVVAGVASSGTIAGRAGLIAAAPAAALGYYDDVAEDGGQAKGLRGHLRELGSGRITTGLIKLTGITASGLLAGTVLARSRGTGSAWRMTADAVASGALIAGTANLLNLFDLRPGRALKVATLVGGPLALANGPGSEVASAVVSSSVASLPSDLAETTMLGDTGANALGAALGVALAAQRSPWLRFGALGGVIAATLASEKVSFSAVIDRTPGLRELDEFGRLAK